MSLNKAIKYGKEHRTEYGTKGQPYAKAVDPMCRNHKGCKWCEDNRTYHNRKQIQKTNEQLEEMKNYSDLPKEIKLQDDIDSLLYTNMKLENRIDKAIEHLYKRNEQNNSALTNKEETIISKHELLKLEIINNKILEDILRGKDE